MKKQKKAMVSITTKFMFVVLTVIFITVLFFNVFGSRAETQIQREKLDAVYLTNNFMMSLLSNPECLALGSTDESKQAPVQGVLDIEKLARFGNLNKEPDCIQNTDFMYTLEVKDIKEQDSWIMGFNNTNPAWADRKIKLTTAVIIQKNNFEKELARAELSVYFGDIPNIYTAVKKACVTQEPQHLQLNTKYNVKYLNSNNTFVIYDDIYEEIKPYFPCRVNDFEIQKGEHILLVDYENGIVEVKS